MNSVITQPSGNKDAREHYNDTVERPVKLDSVRQYLTSQDLDALEKIYPNGNLYVWGVTPSGNNKSKWKKISVGDVTLFSRDNLIYSSAVTTYKIHNQALAKHLWHENKQGFTWEYIYFLDSIQHQSISYRLFNQVVGYKPNFVIQGFNVLDKEKSARLLQHFDLYSSTYYPDTDHKTFENSIEKLQSLEKTDTERIANTRNEQAFLRKGLFENKTFSKCGICNKTYPISMLHAAHIKKRAQCDFNERTDPRIVFPLCVFGCDALFEAGFISIKNGMVTALKKNTRSKAIKDYLNSINGLECHFFDRDTKKYFEWHYAKHQPD